MSWKDILKDEPEPEPEPKTLFPKMKPEPQGSSIDRLKSMSRGLYYWREWYKDKRGRKVVKRNIVQEHRLTEPLAKIALQVLDKVTFTHDQKSKEGNVVVTKDNYIITARWSSYSAIHPVYGTYKQGGEGTIFTLSLTIISTLGMHGRGQPRDTQPTILDLSIELPHATEIDEFKDKKVIDKDTGEEKLVTAEDQIDSYSWMVDWREMHW